MSSLSTGTTTDFQIIKTWDTRFNKQIEDIVKIRFEDTRVLLRKELYNIDSYDMIYNFIDKCAKFFNDLDIQYISEKENINNEIQKNKELELKKIKEEIENQLPNLIFIDNYSKTVKKCTKCLLLLNTKHFYFRDKDVKESDYDLNKEDEYMSFLNKKYRHSCKKCCNESSKKHKETIKINPNYNKIECKCCKNVYNKNNFFKDNLNENYLTICKNCYIVKNKLENNPKQCSECFKILDITNFHYRSNNAYRKECKECRNFNLRHNRKTEYIKCEFCEKTVSKNNLKSHQNTKICLEKQGLKVKRKETINPRSKTVIQLNKDTLKEINKYNSITEASKQTGISRTNIDKCCRKINGTAGGFIWKTDDVF
jgi:hypothetical protein